MPKAKRKRTVNSLLERVRLSEERDRLCNDLSGGMKRRLGIAHVLIGNPRLLVVDEPTSGLDPEERLRFRSLLAELGSEEVSIILSTHIVGDISSACTDMAVLHQGGIMFRGAPSEFIERARGHVWTVPVPFERLDGLKSRYPVVAAIPTGDEWEAQVIADRLEGFPGTPLEPNLEHAYVYYHDYVLERRWQ